MISIIAATSKQINYLKRLSDKDYYSSEQLAKLTKKTASDLIQAWICLNNACANINCIMDRIVNFDFSKRQYEMGKFEIWCHKIINTLILNQAYILIFVRIFCK